MEAEGLYDFEATSGDELSFKKGQIIKILDPVGDENWYKAEMNGNEGFVPKNYLSYEPPIWFLNDCSCSEAEELLLVKWDTGNYLQKDGAFVVRMNKSSPCDFILSVKTQLEVEHLKVLRDGSGKYCLWLHKFNSINSLAANHGNNSVRRGADIWLNNITKVAAKYDGKAPNMLSFKKGDSFLVLKNLDEHWWRAKNDSGEIGDIPNAYMEPMPDPEGV